LPSDDNFKEKKEIFDRKFLESVDFQLIFENNELEKFEEKCNFKRLEKAFKINFTKKYSGKIIDLIYNNIRSKGKVLCKRF
jgi:hypothetical protein